RWNLDDSQIMYWPSGKFSISGVLEGISRVGDDQENQFVAQPHGLGWIRIHDALGSFAVVKSPNSVKVMAAVRTQHSIPSGLLVGFVASLVLGYAVGSIASG